MIHKYYKALLTDCLWRDFSRQNLLKKIKIKITKLKLQDFDGKKGMRHTSPKESW